MTKVISFNEVKQHKNSKSCWIVIHNDVYDVTSYLGEHPGGEEALLEVAGQDGSQAFEDVGHSDDAREIMKKFKIGTLPPGEVTTTDTVNDTRDRNIGKSTIIVYSCDHIKAIEPEKTWRTYDGSSQSRPKPPKPVYKTPSVPKIERRVQSIIVPRESGQRRRRVRRPCEGGVGGSGSTLKWAVVALGGALLIGFILKKYVLT